MPVDDTFTATSGTTSTSSGTLTLTVPRAVAVGKKIILATDRADQAYPTGLTSITDTRGNTWVLADAISLRANIIQVSLSHCDVTTALQVGDTITVTWATVAAAKKNIIAHVCSGLSSGAAQATTGTSVTAGVSSGPNGSSNAPTASVTTTSAACLVVGAFGAGSGAGTLSPGSGYTGGGSVITTSGSNDRGLWTEYRTTTTSGAKTVNGTFGSSATWAEAAVAFAVAGGGGTAPTVSAGADLTSVEPYTLVSLAGTDSGSGGATRAWTCSDPSVVLTNASTATATAAIPGTIAGTTYVFTYSVTDGGPTGSDSMSVQVFPATERFVAADGTEVPLGTWSVS